MEPIRAMEGYCGVYNRTNQAQAAELYQPVQAPEGGCEALLEPYLDAVANELIADQAERDADQERALGAWFAEGGR